MPDIIHTESWGKHNDREVYLYQLCNANGVKVAVTNFGASVQAIIVPGKNGEFDDIALGYDSLQGYLDDPFYMGAIVGRYANRIAGGLVRFDGQEYQLTVKEGGFHHHGGKVGFNKKVWQSTPFIEGSNQGVKLEYLSPDGEEGFPGNLAVTVIYTLNDKDQLEVDFMAETDKTTVLNLTQHSYFNLAGHNAGSILNHNLMLPLNAYLPVNEMQVPNGRLALVEGTPFDFRESTAIGARIDSNDEQLKLSNGYDHSWVIKTNNSSSLKLAATITEHGSGRLMNVYTTEPAIHLYTGNFLDGSFTGKSGANYSKRTGFCLETQHYPDSPNHPHFPDTVLRPGEVFTSKTIFEFGVAS